MAFPSAPTNGQTAVVNGILYTYDATEKSWTKTSQGQSNSDIVFMSGTQTVSGIKTFTANTTFSSNVIVSGISANGTIGTAGQVLFSNGANTYWSTPSGGGTLTTFTASGTWTKPTSGTFAKITAVGPGGGGAAAATAFNAGGGLGGDVVTGIFPLTALPATVAITLGTPGAGGGANTSGTSGTATTFGTFVTAAGGAGGQTGTLGNIAYTGTASAVAATGFPQLSSTGVFFSAYGGDKAANASTALDGISSVIGKGGSSSAAGAGAAGTGYGAGGGAGATAGGAGSAGLVTVEVF